MKSNRGWKIVCMVSLAVTWLMAAETARAQDAPSDQPPPHRVLFERSGPGPVMAQDQLGFVAFEGAIGGKTVTGAPFTATFSTQTTQVLADGNRIQHVTTESVARDGQGRTRRDLTLPAMGPWAAAGNKAPHSVILNDPVAGVQYVLDPERKVAREIVRPGMRLRNGNAPAGRLRVRPNGQNGPNVTTVSLGTQTIGGVSADGMRTTRTIPAGQIGNEKPIEIVTERWFSPDLQMVVMSKRTDPRMGETIFQITNVEQGEPDASLFQVPPDYTVRKGGRLAAQKGGPRK